MTASVRWFTVAVRFSTFFRKRLYAQAATGRPPAIHGTRGKGKYLMEEFASGVFGFRQKGWIDALMPPVNIYLIAGADGLIFDAGYGTKGAVAALARGVLSLESACRQRGRPCRMGRLLPSHAHPDHFAGLGAVSRAIGAEIWLTRTMARRLASRKAYRKAYAPNVSRPSGRIRRKGLGRLLTLVEERTEGLYERLYGVRFVPKPDRIIEDQGVLAAGERLWRVLATPGHCDDHISLYDPRDGVLLGGDNVLRSVTTWLGPPRSSLRDYVRSLERIAALPGLRLILGAHGSPVTHPRRRIDTLLRWREHRTRQVFSAVAEAGARGIGPGRLIRMLYRGEGLGKRYMAEGWVLLTLDYLVHRRLVRFDDSNGRPRFIAGHKDCPRGPLLRADRIDGE